MGNRCRKRHNEISENSTLWIVVLSLILCIVVAGAFSVYFILNYQNGIAAMDNQNFIAAQRYFDKLPFGNQLYADEYAYVRAGVLMESGEYLKSLKAFDQLEDTPVSASIIEKLTSKIIDEGYYLEFLQAIKELQNITIPPSAKSILTTKIYAEGQKQYRAKKLTAAKSYFSEVSTYMRSSDYLLLIECRFRGNADEHCNELIDIIGFEDTADIIMYYEASSKIFLEGTWEDGKSKNPYYFTLDGNGCSYNLPHDSNGQFYTLSHGIYSTYDVWFSTNKQFEFRIIDKDTISVYCYKDKSTHKLYRK